MKKIILTIALSLTYLPVFAVCSITGGACNFDQQTLEEKLVPNNLQNMERTDSFQKNNIQPYNIEKVTIPNHEQASSTPKANDYNANCQFGVCLGY